MKRLYFTTLALVAMLVPLAFAKAATETVVYTFKGGASDGAQPQAGLLMGSGGALYGTTAQGGSCAGFSTGCGTVFKLTPPAAGKTAWTETVLYKFKGSVDGRYPSARLIRDAHGNLYGTTVYGGGGCQALLAGDGGCGTVFRLAPPVAGKTAWTETVLHRFKGGSDGYEPFAGLIMDSTGALYGTTSGGGGFSCPGDGMSGCGTAFKVTPPALGKPNWTQSILHRFTGGVDGSVPYGDLIADGQGGFYGTTSAGGKGSANQSSYGIAFRLIPPAAGKANWNLSVVHYLGVEAWAGLVADSQGSLFGSGVDGQIFKLTPPAAGKRYWAMSIVSETYGGNPLVFDKAGNLYATSQTGGENNGGTVYKLTREPTGWPMTILYNFCPARHACVDGKGPTDRLTLGGDGAIYGTTEFGGAGHGLVFKVVP